MSQICRWTDMDLLAVSVSLVAIILSTAIGWLLARSRFTRTIAELKSNLVLERRLNKQLSETVKVQVDAMPSLMQAATSDEPGRQSMVLSG